MIAGIHQPHYFPWIGYFDKMRQVDKFVLLDEVQLEKGSYMYRNRILNDQGQPSYLTMNYEKHGIVGKKYREIETKGRDEWIRKQRKDIGWFYRKSEYFGEVIPYVNKVLDVDSNHICDYAIKSISVFASLLNIDTPIVLQSLIEISNKAKNNQLNIGICESLGCDTYLSGIGAKKYNDEELYAEAKINLYYQEYTPPKYTHINSEVFIPGLSLLDMFFSIGISATKKLFWDNK